jgi:ubiquinone/menaquinone biosynthesis C-methylase UbiE
MRLHIGHHNRPHAFSGRHSRVYNVAARRLLRPVYRRLARDAAELAPRGGRVLDVGTGPGVLLVELGARRPDLSLTGVDLSADMVAAARRNLAAVGPPADGGRSVEVADVIALPFEDGAFDLVISSFSLHHWDHPDRAVGELARVLRPGGRLCIYDFRFAPFQVVVDEAAARSVFGAEPVQQSPVRAGFPLFGRAVRLVMTAGPAA